MVGWSNIRTEGLLRFGSCNPFSDPHFLAEILSITQHQQAVLRGNHTEQNDCRRAESKKKEDAVGKMEMPREKEPEEMSKGKPKKQLSCISPLWIC